MRTGTRIKKNKDKINGSLGMQTKISAIRTAQIDPCAMLSTNRERTGMEISSEQVTEHENFSDPAGTKRHTRKIGTENNIFIGIKRFK
jgi:hypothetical protein